MLKEEPACIAEVRGWGLPSHHPALAQIQSAENGRLRHQTQLLPSFIIRLLGTHIQVCKSEGQEAEEEKGTKH